MKKKSNRIISVILAAMLVVTSIVTSGLITTSAASGDTVYCETDGFEPYCYMWIDSKTSNGSINIKDATLIQKYIVGINTGYNIGSAI